MDDKIKYIVMDDMRRLGSFARLKEVYDAGFIKGNLCYFYQKFEKERFYHKDNIMVYNYRDYASRCAFLGYMIYRRAMLSPDPTKTGAILSKALKEITNTVDELQKNQGVEGDSAPFF